VHVCHGISLMYCFKQGYVLCELFGSPMYCMCGLVDCGSPHIITAYLKMHSIRFMLQC
jgi:hypothetical protein